jgi:hypothetical protein
MIDGSYYKSSKTPEFCFGINFSCAQMKWLFEDLIKALRLRKYVSESRHVFYHVYILLAN